MEYKIILTLLLSHNVGSSHAWLTFRFNAWTLLFTAYFKRYTSLNETSILATSSKTHSNIPPPLQQNSAIYKHLEWVFQKETRRPSSLSVRTHLLKTFDPLSKNFSKIVYWLKNYNMNIHRHPLIRPLRGKDSGYFSSCNTLQKQLKIS